MSKEIIKTLKKKINVLKVIYKKSNHKKEIAQELVRTYKVLRKYLAKEEIKDIHKQIKKIKKLNVKQNKE